MWQWKKGTCKLRGNIRKEEIFYPQKLWKLTQQGYLRPGRLLARRHLRRTQCTYTCGDNWYCSYNINYSKLQKLSWANSCLNSFILNKGWGFPTTPTVIRPCWANLGVSRTVNRLSDHRIKTFVDLLRCLTLETIKYPADGMSVFCDASLIDCVFVLSSPVQGSFSRRSGSAERRHERWRRGRILSLCH